MGEGERRMVFGEWDMRVGSKNWSIKSVKEGMGKGNGRG